MNSTLPRLPILSTTPRATDRSPSSAASKSSNFSVELPQLMVRILTERSPRSASRSVAHRPEEILRGSLELFPAGLGAEVVAFAPVGVLQCLMRLYPHPADRIPLLPRKTCLGYRLVWLPPSEQGPVEPQIICDQACQQEPLAHELTALHTKHFRFLRVLQRPQRLLGTLLDQSTRNPPAPPRTWSGMPPARPATIGVSFQSVSETTSPKPSRIDFCITTSERRWKALTSTFPTPVRLVKR